MTSVFLQFNHRQIYNLLKQVMEVLMPRRLMMVSTHGYVSAHAELGRPDTGGQVVYLIELSKSLARLGFEIDILTRRFDGRPLLEMVAPGVRLLRFPCGGDHFIPKEVLADYIPDWCDEVLASPELENRKYEFLNTHYWDAGVAGEILSLSLRIPHLHTPHSLGVLKRDNEAWGPAGASPADNLHRRIKRERIVYHRSDRIIATTLEQANCLIESDDYNIPGEKIDPIPPGYDDGLFFPAPPTACQTLKRKMGVDSPLLFTSGRIAANKGYDLLIQALPGVLRRVPFTRLLLAIGSEHSTPQEQAYLQQLRQLAQDLGVLDQISFTNCVSQDRLAELNRAADVFILCSRYEPFGMTAVEAMACGTPTVVTTRGGLWEELTWGADCLYCDPCDSEALAHSICSILQHSKVREQLQSRGAQTVKAKYTWKQIAKRFWSAYIQGATEPAIDGARSCIDAR